jgi:ABC-type polysaccharide/polyol phosphate transport system ATPase subunit
MKAIDVRDLTKSYRVGVGRARIREMLPYPFDRWVRRLFPKWWTRNTFPALDAISLTVQVGSSIGIVGHNGAGKTTLLKVIAGVTEPTEGRIGVSGRIAALLDVLVGFHPELTGRENIYLLGAMHGFGRREMARRVDRILEFAEIAELADTPLKRYSAGMGARLGFAIIATLDVDVLLIDEVLAVGDARFQQKCVRWLTDFRSSGGTLLFVSHNLALVRNMTDQAVWLDHGKVVQEGSTHEVLAEYARAMERRDLGRAGHQKGESEKLAKARGLHRWGTGGARVDEVLVEEPGEGASGLGIVIRYEAPDLDEALFCVGFVDEGGQEIGGSSSPIVVPKGQSGEVRCTIRPMPFRPGIYFPVVSILSSDGLVRDRWRLDRAIVVDQDGQPEYANDLGPVDLPAVWTTGSRRRR